ncbi:alpha-2-macroglobulin-like protein 1 [Labrus bergylta]|uniref:alpha-2-macroglobulin-like protein 1 n=1 Tax=Labrus bergylta TaxID=56723 RepID=UPI0033142AAA
MDRPGTQMWTLCVLMTWMCVALAAPHYMVAIPAVVEAGAESRFSVSLMKPSGIMVMTITLRTKQATLTLLHKISSLEFHNVFKFQVPSGLKDEVADFEVELRGAKFYSKEVRKVMIRTYEPMTFVQTDKPIYLPGQTVKFRVVTIDTKFRPATQLYDIINLEDPNSNKIGQWLKETSNGKILQLSFSLNAEAREGIYNIIVSIGENKIYWNFKVEKYVLPKFEVNIKAPDKVSIGQEEIKVKVCAQYTYKQSVPGLITAEMCRPLYRYIRETEDIKPPCFVETMEADESGCATFVFKMSTFKKIVKVVQASLLLSAKVEEEETGITHQQEKRIEISFVIGKLIFIDTPKVYAMGSDVEGKIKAVDYDDTPIPDMPVYLFEGEIRSERLTTDCDGVADFTFSTDGYNGDIYLSVSINTTLDFSNHDSYNVEEGYFEILQHKISMTRDVSVDSKTVSSLEVQKKEKPIPCDTVEKISVKFTIVGERQGTATFIYVVLARGAIVMQGYGKIEVQDQTVTQGEMSINIRVSPEMSPDVQLVAYAVLPSEMVIAHSADFSTEKCFRHKVSLEFFPSSAVPGEGNTLQVTAQPNSLCGVSIVDQSVLIKEPGKSLDSNRIFDLLPITKVYYIPFEVLDTIECLVVRPKRSIWPRPDVTDDPYTVFTNVGLKMATNLGVRVPSCLQYEGRKYVPDQGYVVFYEPMPMNPQLAEASGGTLPPPIVTVRTFFPETWIWDLIEIGETGTKNVPLTVPDTITTWETEAFCLSSQGFGLAPRKELTVFQPFFLELSLPYSIIRGENFELKATVFNYLSSCIMVTVTPAPSSDFTLFPYLEDEFRTCLCGNERKSFRWTLTPSVIGDVIVSATAEAVVSDITCNNEVVSVPERGRSDTVSRTLKVKAEGIEKIKSSNLLLCPNDETLTEEVEIQLPEDEIDGSGRSLVSVLGDIMGRALKNLDGLLRMPYGCAEQNMAVLAPNIYILQYLEDTKQLTPDIKAKGTNFLTSGYQRQLNYKNNDGAFSTFGSGGSGNTWLTAFTMRSFVKAQNFIFIDPKVINDAMIWLTNSQKGSGNFKLMGKFFNNQIKGGVSDEVIITAYITAAFLEMNPTVTETVTKSLSCLKKTIDNVANTYATALQAYVFTLAGDMETSYKLLSHLDSVAIKEGGFTHWAQTATNRYLSVSVEMTSYVLLALLSPYSLPAAPPSPEALGYASGIVRWLTRQQKYYGGFSSTQDTVVALQALALYSTLVFNPEGSSSVNVKFSDEEIDFEVNQDNKLVYQEQLVMDQTGKYTVEVEGNACVSVQISYHYNVPPTPIATTLDVEVSTKAECSSSSTRPTMTLTLKIVYTGKRETTNMVIVDIKMLSGFVPDEKSLKELKGEAQVERIEHEDDHVVVYIKELSKDIPIQYDLELRQELPVSDLKPAVVKIYDYYQQSDQDEANYNYPCVAGDQDEANYNYPFVAGKV